MFFEKIEGYDSEVSYKFAQCLDKDIVSFDTLKFKLTRELLAEATGILDEGEFWFKKVPFTFNAQRYLLPGVVADWEKVFQFKTLNLSGLSLLKSCKAMSPVRVDLPLCSSIILDSFNISVMNLK